jgi:hypothetical protein
VVSGGDLGDAAGFAREGGVGFDDLEHLVVGDVGVGLAGGLLDQRAFESELGTFVDHIYALLVERKEGHTHRSAVDE